MKKKSMVTKREKDLLQYMYGLALNLNIFIRENGYTKDDFDMCNIHINLACEKEYVEAQFSNFTADHVSRIVSYYAFGNKKPALEETTYEDKKDDEIE
jgi:hypothetical protein